MGNTREIVAIFLVPKIAVFPYIVMTRWDHSGHKYVVTIPIGKDPLPIGTLQSIMKQAGGEDFEAFCAWIDDNC